MDMSEDLHSAKLELESIKEHSEVEVKPSELEEKFQQLLEEKTAVEAKLAHYLSENMELQEKIDKLNKGSSAESIEMVNLSPQENEEYQKALGGVQKELGDPEISQELNESLRSLREESSELMSKIELFTIERREVLDKLDAMTLENQVLVSSIESIREEKVALEHENESLKEKSEQIEKFLSDLQSDKEELLKQVSELSEHRAKLQEEINKLVKEGLDLASAETSGEVSTSSIDKESCEQLLKQLDAEIQNLNKNKDKHQKLKISKKLSDNAKNVHAVMTNLLVDYYKNLDECKSLRDDLEKVKSLLATVSSMEKDEEEIKNLQQKLKETEQELMIKCDAFDEMRVNIEVYFMSLIKI